MLRPSYSELMDTLNEDRDLDSKITSRYIIVIATAKRARQIVNGANCESSFANTDKAVSIAISELERGLIKLYPEGLPEEYVDLTYDKIRQGVAAVATSPEKIEPDDLSDLDLSYDSEDLSAMEDFDSDDDFDSENEFDDDFDEDFDEDFDAEPETESEEHSDEESF